MRIEILTQNDPLYILPFLEEFVRYYAGEFTITQISCCPTMGKRSRKELLISLFCLYGPLGFVRLCSRLVKNRLFGLFSVRRGAKKFYTLRQLCAAYEIPYASIGSPNADEFFHGIRERAPDLIVSVACPYILKARILDLPKLGCINIHHAPLPRYRGMMPTFWQMYHDEKTVGLTIHQMVGEIDKGSILLRRDIEIEPKESLDHLMRRTKRIGAHCMAEVIRRLNSEDSQAVPLSEENSSYFTFPTLEQIRIFRRRGLRAI